MMLSHGIMRYLHFLPFFIKTPDKSNSSLVNFSTSELYPLTYVLRWPQSLTKYCDALTLLTCDCFNLIRSMGKMGCILPKVDNLSRTEGADLIMFNKIPKWADFPMCFIASQL